MMIPIVYTNGRHDMIKDFMLSKLIDSRGISKFKRSSGWVDINSSEVRNSFKSDYTGPERRNLN